jgi:hypothetical protein
MATAFELEPPDALELLAPLARDPFYGWSIGSFGALGEFSRDAEEYIAIERNIDSFELVTGRGALRIAPKCRLHAIAYETLTANGEGWGQGLALCVPRPSEDCDLILPMGSDRAAICSGNRDALLFDLGVATGATRFCVRTADSALVDALTANAGRRLLVSDALIEQIVRAQPHRILLSPAGRIEVFQPIPPSGGKSPTGPHTHLLPKLIVKRRTHSSNIPIPEGWQPVLTVHPRSPWRLGENGRRTYDAGADATFAPLLARFECSEDKAIRDSVSAAVNAGVDVSAFTWPQTRRGRTLARITLRRLAASNVESASSWRAVRDRGHSEEDQDAQDPEN